MPSTAQGGSSSQLPEWRQPIKDRINEDPARWLDKDLLEPQAVRQQVREREDTWDEVVLVTDHDVSPPGEVAQLSWPHLLDREVVLG